jgi:hypothetical protein
MRYWPKENFPKRSAAVLPVLVVISFLLGYMIRGPGEPTETMRSGTVAATEKDEQDHETLYACPMGDIPPRKTPGRCPVCGMELVPIERFVEQTASSPRLKLSKEAADLAQVETAVVVRKSVATEIKALGQVVWNPPLPLLVKLFIYESDLAWIRDGAPVSFKTDAYPGEVFRGAIVFRGILSDPTTRTFTVGVDIMGGQNLLMPGMVVYASIFPFPTADGTFATRPLPLEQSPLVIPASAPLITGKRAVVYVEVPGKEGVYEGREIVLGPKADDWYIVRQGLAEGENVVVNGNFKIDSELQILAKRSMMSSPHAGEDTVGSSRGEATSLWVPFPQPPAPGTTGENPPGAAGAGAQR